MKVRQKDDEEQKKTDDISFSVQPIQPSRLLYPRLVGILVLVPSLPTARWKVYHARIETGKMSPKVSIKVECIEEESGLTELQ